MEIILRPWAKSHKQICLRFIFQERVGINLWKSQVRKPLWPKGFRIFIFYFRIDFAEHLRYIGGAICGTALETRGTKEKVLPKYKDAYKHYGAFIKNNMSNVLNASNVRILAEEVCRATTTETTVERINSISMDINTMTAIIDATFDTYRFV